MKILITGGAGYIGSHTIIEFIEQKKYDVISIDNYSNSSIGTFDRIEQITGKRIVNYNVDMCDINELNMVFNQHKDIIGVIHFAAFKAVNESVNDPLTYYHNNLTSLINILKLIKKYNINYFIFSSSCSVYGNISILPVNEETPLGKVQSPYANTKLIGEQIIKDFINANCTIKAVALRYFNPVGAHYSGLIGESPLNEPNNLVPLITRVASGKKDQLTVYGTDYDTRDGSCLRDYIHVSDIANAHLKALEYIAGTINSPNYSVFNLGTEKGVSVIEMINMFEKITGIKLNVKNGNRREGDVAAIYSDSSKALKYLGWKPKFGIEEMISSAWKWEQNI